ncbi:MAG: 2-amino-4-hydroxy-6-hydroxymethyldihydropteridine diphosphokinase [Muribaculaceae bacterium]|nr:2-amino-4-hydroxy-6-hydroxymethyldihydropteridine diphosphokinase [Muribaculaceae bacterium]
MKTNVYLNIGSNSGDRQRFLDAAVAAILELDIFSGAHCETSDAIETEPWGFESTQLFLNIGVKLTYEHDGEWNSTELEALLDAIQSVEKRLSATAHRNQDGTYRDREVDIDIIAVDNIEYESQRLCIPHRQMCSRYFVLKPMSILAPEWRHPKTNLTAGQML